MVAIMYSPIDAFLDMNFVFLPPMDIAVEVILYHGHCNKTRYISRGPTESANTEHMVFSG